MPQNDFVALYGLGHLDLSLRALYELTKRFTAEGAIRTFLQAHPEQTLNQLAQWSTDSNCHVRRLVSEGTRPCLPLAPRLPAFVKNPRPVLALLEHLKNDPVLMVRRSVANNLNDIAKDHPDLVVETLARWQPAANPETQWIIGHATRTLLKQGHTDALALLGYPSATSISLASFQLKETRVRMGEAIVFAIDIQSTADAAQQLMIDYVVHHMKAKKQLRARETLRLSKRHAFRPLSTRVYYPGRHALEIQINGQRMGWLEFDLVLEHRWSSKAVEPERIDMTNKRLNSARLQIPDRPVPEQFLAAFPVEIRALANQLRALVTRAVPDGDESVSTGWRLLGY